MTSIALLTPTRDRPEQCRRMVDSAYNTSASAVRVYLGLTEGIDSIDACVSSSATIAYAMFPDGMPTVHKWNLLAQMAMKEPDVKLFMLGADDIEFMDNGWDERLIESYNNLENKIHVWALQDSRDALGTPHPIFSREWIEAMSWMLPPYFMHFYPDTWSIEIAKANNCFTHLREFKLNHHKPSDIGKPDQTHSRIRQMGWDARDRYVAESCKHVLELEKQRLAKVMNG